MSGKDREEEVKEVMKMADLEKRETAMVFSPRLDIVEREDNFTVWADLPGVKPEGMEINLDGDRLTIRGKVTPLETEGLPLLFCEYGEGDFEATLRVSREVDQEHISAEIRDGLLVLTLPKAAAAKPRQIQVKAA